jgi:outer membrane protein TolC
MTRPTGQAIRLLAAAALLWPAAPRAAAAQGVPSDTLVVSDLESLLATVRAENPALAAVRIGAEAMAERPDQVGALPDPTFGLSIQPIPIVTARGSQRSQWQVQQAIPFPGKLGLREEAAGWEAEAASSNADRVELDLLERTKTLWYDLSRIARQQALVREFQTSLRTYEDVARTRYEVGEGTQQAVLKAQLERNTLTNRLIELAKMHQSMLESLSQLADRPLAIADSVLFMPDLPATALSSNELLVEARKRRPEVDALDASLRHTDVMIELARKEWLPDFGIGLTYFDIADTDMPPSADGRDAIAIGVTVRIPLQRGRLRSRLEETKLLREQVVARQEALDASFRTEIADLLQRLDREQEQLELFTDALIPQATTTLAASVSAYTTGRATFLDLLDAERMLFNLRWSYEATRSGLLKSGAELERAIGVARLDTLNQ